MANPIVNINGETIGSWNSNSTMILNTTTTKPTAINVSFDNISSGMILTSSNTLLGSSFNTSLPYVTSSIVSKEDKDSSNDITFTQDKTVFSSVNMNSPLVLDQGEISICFQDVYGNNNYDYSYLFENADGTLFGLAYYDEEKDVHAPINEKYEIFKLHKKMMTSSYYVCAFDDLPNNKISYIKYEGKIQMIDDAPFGLEVPYYENLVMKDTIDPSSIEILSYEVVYRDSCYNNIVLKPVYVPEMVVSDDNKTLTSSFGLTYLCDSYYISENCVYDSSGKQVDDISGLMKKFISDYSLASELSLISTKNKYSYIKAHTLFEPVYVYTYQDKDKYLYHPYDVIDNTSSYSIYCYLTTKGDDKELNFTVLYDLENVGSCTIKYDGDFKNGKEILSPLRYNGRNFYEAIVSTNNYTVYFSVSSICQDEEFNYIEYDEPFVSDDLEKTIVHVLTLTPSDAYLNKIDISATTHDGMTSLFSKEEIKVFDVYEKNAGITYLNFIQDMTTSCNVEYVNYLENASSYYFEPSISSISYKLDRVYERTGINDCYVYYSPNTKSYEIYDNVVLNYKNDVYGCTLFNDIDKTNLDRTKLNDANTYLSYEIELVEVYKRSFLSYTGLNVKNAVLRQSYITNNVETQDNTYAIEPFVLANDYKYEFDKYSFVEPKSSYIINYKSITEVEFPQNKDNETYDTSYKVVLNNFTYADSFFNNLTVYSYNEHSENNKYYTYIESNIDNLVDDKDSIKDFFNNFSEVVEWYDTSEPSSFTKESDLKSYNMYFYDSETSYSYLMIDGVTIEKLMLQMFKPSPDIYWLYNGEELYSVQNTYQLYTSYEILLDKKLTCEENTNNKPNEENTNDEPNIAYYKIEITSPGIYTYNDVSYAYSSCIDYHKAYFVPPQNTYTCNEIINQDGYWKREYNKTINPFVTTTYTYASNPIEISNAYVVPTTKNECLGFIHKNKIAYNDFVEEFVEEYKYTYYTDENIQVPFIENDENKVINVGDGKYFGMFVSKIQKLGYLSKTNTSNLTFNPIFTAKWKYTVKSDLDTKSIMTIIGEPPKNDNDEIDETKRTCHYDFWFSDPKITEIEAYIRFSTNYVNNYTTIEYTYNKVLHHYEYRLDCLYAIYSDNENKNVPRYISRDLLTYNLTGIVEVYQRMFVNKQKKLKEFIIQEDTLEPQVAKIDTPFGLVNGKKVIITDQIYVPESYTTVVTIDPDTYEYVSERVKMNDAYMAYSYEVEDIPFITATYLYSGGDNGIRIDGMNDLIKAMYSIGNNSNGSLPISNASGDNSSQSAYNNYSNSLSSIPSYLAMVSSSLVYINEAIDRNTKNLASAFSYDNKTNVYLANLSYELTSSLTSLNNTSLEMASTNTSNTINAQKNMVSKISESIENQTSTLSRLMMLNIIGQSGAYSYTTASLFENVLSNMTSSTPKNWQSVTKVGYQEIVDQEVASYKSIGYKHTKVIGKDQRISGTKKVTINHRYDSPSYVSFAYSSAFEQTSSTTERIGLHLNKESRDFTYNGYIYHEDYYTYQNIADILADLHVSNRMPTRKEFIIDVSKRLYINSDFIFSYTSPNEYAIRAIRRADVLWSELVNANVVEPEESSYRPLPNVSNNTNYWWKDKTKVAYFAYAFNIDFGKLTGASEETFVKIDNILMNSIDDDSIKTIDDTLKSITYNVVKKDGLGYIWNIKPEAINDNVLTKISKTITDFQSNADPKDSQLVVPRSLSLGNKTTNTQKIKRPSVTISKDSFFNE